MSKPQITDYSRIILATSAALGLLYAFAFLPSDTPALAMFSKGAPVGLLALYAALNRNILLAVALGFGTVGDVFLAGNSERAFMWGLSAFLIGHLLYIWLIWPARLSWPDVSATRRTAVGLVMGAGILQGWYLLPYTRELALPVTLYTAILMAMTLLAIASRYPLRLAGLPAVGLGAILFFFSDLVLGLSLFSPDIDVPRGLNWSLYYPGQLLLAVGLVGGMAKRKQSDRSTGHDNQSPFVAN
ncbi:MAG: lysoplasmalogenase [Proteobacteria bacterium]|nr:lysoplasmalogenase [Pseudomonadota bacterium]